MEADSEMAIAISIFCERIIEIFSAAEWKYSFDMIQFRHPPLILFYSGKPVAGITFEQNPPNLRPDTTMRFIWDAYFKPVAHGDRIMDLKSEAVAIGTRRALQTIFFDEMGDEDKIILDWSAMLVHYYNQAISE